jgi:replicative DNA helicase
MDLDLAFIKAVLAQENGFNVARQESIGVEMLEGEGQGAWKFISDHYVEHGELPSEDLVYAKLGLALPDVVDGVKTLVSEIKGRAVYEKVKALHEDLTAIIEDRHSRINETVPVITEFLNELHRSSITGQKIGNLLALGPEVMAFYDRMKAGERGIQTPWDAMNEATLGWWPGDFIVFAARMGVGKTFCMLHLARQAWIDGKKVLFVGTEMNRLNLAMRFFAIHFKIPYKEFRRGEVGYPREDEIRKAIQLISGDTGIYVVGDDFDADINVIISAIEQTRPDIVFVDGLYLVRNKGHDRHTRVSNTADDLKRTAKRIGLPIVTSTQFNREVSANSRSEVSAENIGISDVIGWNADVMYGLFQKEDMKEDSEMGFRPMKIREGEAKDFFAHWDFDRMDFSQSGTEDDSGKKFVDDFDGIDGIKAEDTDGDPLF